MSQRDLTTFSSQTSPPTHDLAVPVNGTTVVNPPGPHGLPTGTVPIMAIHLLSPNALETPVISFEVETEAGVWLPAALVLP